MSAHTVRRQFHDVSGGSTKNPWQPPGVSSLFTASGRSLGLAASAANRSVVHEHAASAAVLQHGREAIASRLNHFAALGITARVGPTNAVLG